MENLNAEQVKKALECWASGKPCEGGVCDLFDASTFTCDRWTGKNALALINSQEQRIKELDDDNARLYYICQSYALQYGTATDKEVFLKKERADTVRKMQERLRFEIINKPSEFRASQATVDFLNGMTHRQHEILDILDQIAKEMIEKGD